VNVKEKKRFYSVRREWVVVTFANTVSDGRKLVNERKSRRRKNGRKDGPIAVFRIA